MNRIFRIAPTALVVLCLTGCFIQDERIPPTYEDLNRPFTDDDRYPALPERSLPAEIDVASSRKVGEAGDYALFLSRFRDSEETCLTAYASPTLWNISCGSGTYEAENNQGTLLVIPDAGSAESGWVRISANVYQTSEAGAPALDH